MSSGQRHADTRDFLVLPENQLAVAAINRIGPEVKRRTVRLVTLVGDAGTGKSHLVRELVSSWAATKPQRKIHVITASQFAAQLADASVNQSIAQFHTRYRNEVALFVCEDVHVLANRKETQQHFQATIDDVISKGGVVLLSSNQMPGAVGGLTRKIVNRMHGGLCVTLGLPSEKSRRKLIQHWATSEAHQLSDESIEEIAKTYAVSPRELFGLLTQLKIETRLLKSPDPHDRSSIQTMIEERQPGQTMDISELSRMTAIQFGLKVADLRGPRRSQTISLARQTVMFLAREYLALNYIEIGKYFHRGNHSTVIHACRKIMEERKINAELDLIVQGLAEKLRKTPK